MAYRLGVDVGGTFTDLFLVDDEDHRQWRVKTPSTPADPSEGVLAGVRRICAEAGIEPGDAAQRRPRHDRRHQRRARVQGRARRAHHHAGLRPDPAPRALADARAAGRLDHHDQARPAGLAGRHARGGRAHGRARRDARPGRPRAGRGRRSRDLDRLRRRVADGRRSSTPTSTAATSARSPTIVEEIHPGFPVTISSDVLPEFREYERTLTACMNSYVRPHGGRLRRPPAGARCASSGVRSELDILRSDAGVMTPREAARNPVYGVLSRAERRRRRRAARRRARRLPEHPHLRHGRHVDRRLAVPGRRADDRPRDDDRPVPDQGPVGRRAHGRRGRRLDRARARAHAARCASAPSRRAPSPGPAAYGARRRGADGDRRQRRRRPPAAAADRRRDGARRRGGAHRRRQTIAEAIGPVARRGGRGHPRRSSTRTWPARCA